MNSKQYSDIITLIQQDPISYQIWNINIMERSKLQILFQESKSSKWEVDCDLDTFIEFQISPLNQLIPKRQPLSDATEIKNWIDNVFQNNQKDNYLIPAIAQDKTGRILMQAWVNEEALQSSLKSEYGTYFSRSRNKLWIKGEESGHFQKNLEWEILLTNPVSLIYHADQIGAACHTGEYSCFFRELKLWSDPKLVRL